MGGRAVGGRAGVWLAALLLGAACLVGCERPRGTHFEDEELLLGLDGRYKLDVRGTSDASAYTVVVLGDSVTAELGSEEGVLSPRVVLYVDAVAEGVSVVELRRHRRVVDTLTIEIAAVEEIHGELMLDLEQVLLEEPFAMLVGDGGALRIVGMDANGRRFDRFWRELTDVGPGILLTQVWRNVYAFEARAAGAIVVTADVGGGRWRQTTLHVLERTDITTLALELQSETSLWVIGRDAEGLRVHLWDAVVEGEGVLRPGYPPGVYDFDADVAPGTVVTASWSGMTATYTF